MNAETTWVSAALTHPGKVRDHNEDAYFARPEQCIWAIADGMGGHAAGDLASQTIVQALEGYQHSPLLGHNVFQVSRMLHQVNAQLLTLAGQDERKIIGSTIALLLLHRHHGVCLWAGDSRIYRFRNQILKQLTRDHNEAEELIDQGMQASQAAQSPYAQSITRAVGAYEQLRLEAQIVEIEANDCFLLCSDGLNKEIPDGEIEYLLQQHPPARIPQVLLERCLQRQGRDNISIVCVYSTS